MKPTIIIALFFPLTTFAQKAFFVSLVVSYTNIIEDGTFQYGHIFNNCSGYSSR